MLDLPEVVMLLVLTVQQFLNDFFSDFFPAVAGIKSFNAILTYSQV